MEVPFLNLQIQHQLLKDEIIQVVEKAINSTRFVGGDNVSQFEKEFAEFCKTKFAVGVNSGTDALRFALLSAGIQKGDEVITVPNTFIATTEAISQAGGKIVFIDIDEKTGVMDINKLKCEVEERINKGYRLKGIIPVHLYGHVANMEPVLEIAQEYNLFVIEDACQAHGASYINGNNSKGYKMAGSMGIAGCFSFYPGKNLGACGEGGAVVTNNEEIVLKIKMLRDHGQIQKYYHEIEGYNGRLDAIQAGILRVKLKYISKWNEKRRQNAFLYNELLKDIPNVIIPYDPPWSRGVYHLYVIKINNREILQKKLAERGISTGLHYPIPLHLQNAYKYLGYKKGDFPVSEKHAEKILSLPMFPDLTPDQIEYVAKMIESCID